MEGSSTETARAGAAPASCKTYSVQAAATAAELPPTITIPPLACSPPLRLHPSYASIRAKADEWLLSVLKPTSWEEKETLVQSHFHFLTCALFSDVDDTLCFVIAKLMAWLFVFDDIADDMQDGLGTSYETADQLLKELDRALAREASCGGGLGAALPAVLADRHRRTAAVDVWLGWWSEMCTKLSSAYQARFRLKLQRFSAAVAAQVVWRQAKVIPDLYSYIITRRDTSGVEVFLALLEGGLGVELDNNVLDCPLLTQLRSAAMDHAVWVNDLMSFKVEYGRGDYYCNIVAIVFLQPSSPAYGNLQKSVDIVSKMIEQRDHDFARLLAEARGCKALMEKPAMAKYLCGIADWLVGNLHYSYATCRYYDGVDLAKVRPVDAPLTIDLK